MARRAVPEPVLPAGLADPAEQHVRVPESGLVAQRRNFAEPGRLFPPEPGPRRLAAALHRERHRRQRGTGIGADGRYTFPRRRAARGDPLRGLGRRRRRTDARLHVVLHLQLLRLRRGGGRPGVPPGRHRGPVVPAQPLRQGPGRPHTRRGVVHHNRSRRQHAARRHLVREHTAGPGPRLAPDSGSDAQLQLERAALLAAVRLAVPATSLQVVRGGNDLRRAVRPERRDQAVHGRRVARGPVQRRSEPGGRFGFGPALLRGCDIRDAGRGPRPVRGLRRELQGDQQSAARGAGAQPWTCSSPRLPRTSTSDCSTRGIGSHSEPRGTRSISRIGSSTSGRRQRPAPTTSSRAAAPTSTRAGSTPAASSCLQRCRCRARHPSTPRSP